LAPPFHSSPFTLHPSIRRIALSTPVADVLLITWNGREHTLAAIEGVEAQIGSGTAQARDVLITVVDNGSNDGTARAVGERYPRVRLIVLPKNRGFTGGIDEGVRTSPARNVIFLNNDAVPEPGWLGAMIDAIEAAPRDVIAVAGKIVDMGGTLIDFVRGVMTFDGHAFQEGFRKPLGSVEEPAAGGELLFPCGGNMIVRRAPFQTLGGFDDDYFAYLEDVDFGWRSWLSGWRTTYEPQAIVRHASSATSDRLGAFERGVLFERNALQTAIKNYESDLLNDFAGPVFLTLLHRFHHYVTTRNADVSELMREPFSGALRGSPQRSLWQRVKRKVTGRRTTIAALDDDLTAMQFRALDWFFRNSERIAAKRAVVQARRTRSDREIFERFPIHYVPTYPGDYDLMHSSLFRALKPSVRSVEKTLGDIMRT
jgi:GT2 family glycosyltransferase